MLCSVQSSDARAPVRLWLPRLCLSFSVLQPQLMEEAEDDTRQHQTTLDIIGAFSAMNCHCLPPRAS